MKLQLTPEMSVALHANQGDVLVIDPDTDRVYVLVDDETYIKALRALRKQEDRQAIQSGIDDLESGRMETAEVAHRHGREHLLSTFLQ